MADNPIPLSVKKMEFDLRDMLDDLKKDIFLNMNCHAIAQVQSVDLTKQTLIATLYYPKVILKRATVGGEAEKYTLVQEKYPQIECPFVSLRGGTAGLICCISHKFCFFNLSPLPCPPPPNAAPADLSRIPCVQAGC